MPYNLLLLPLLGGYMFIHLFRYTRFRANQLDGYRLLMESAFFGLLMAMISWVACKVLVRIPCAAQAWALIAPPVPFSGVAFGSLVLGLVLAPLLNWALNASGLMSPVEMNRRAVDRHGNNALRLLHAAQAEERVVMVTLKNRKTYIGLVVSAPTLAATDSFAAIIPMLSGYRDSNTLELVLTTDYLRVYDDQRADPAEFAVVLPIPEISMLSYFDQSLYPEFEIQQRTRVRAAGAGAAG